MKSILIYSKILLLCIILFSCKNNADNNKLLKSYDKNSTQYQIVLFFRRANKKGEVSKTKISSLVEYYKVFYTRKNRLPFREEYFKNRQRKWFKLYHYSKINNKSVLKSVIIHNNKKLKLNEIVYRNKKPVVIFKYIYYPKTKSVKRIERYEKGLREGWWSYFNSKKRLTKKEFYKKNKLDGYWLYKYDKSGSLIGEENYNKEGKLKYKHTLK